MGVLTVARLTKEFFAAPATELAPALLGKLLCRRVGEEILRVPVTETECYFGEEDTACHAHRGLTPRTATLYREGGAAYVYLCYGIHDLLNVVTGPAGHPEAVLIRGVEGTAGPGRVTKRLQIHRTLNGVDLTLSEELWLEDGPSPAFDALPRVGIGYASPEDQARLWRFVAK